MISPPGVEALERAINQRGAMLAELPDFAPMLKALPFRLPFGADITLEELGMSNARPAALFVVEHGTPPRAQVVLLLPVIDRDKLLAKVEGTKGGGPVPDRLGPLACRPRSEGYACSTNEMLLDKLGQVEGSLGAQQSLAGARGDLELIAAGLKWGGATPGDLSLAVTFDRGEMTMRGGVRGLAPSLLAAFGAAPPLPDEAKGSAGFLAFNAKEALAALPPIPLLPGVTSTSLASALAGPVTVTVRAGATRLDQLELRAPLADEAPLRALLARCERLPGGLVRRVGGNCLFDVPGEPVTTLDLWLEGSTFRVGRRPSGAKAAPVAPSADEEPASVPWTAFATELSKGEWHAVAWGRGASFVRPPIPRASDPRQAQIQEALVKRTLRTSSLLSEVGVGVRVDKDVLRAVVLVRTIFSNPDGVVARLLSISPEALDTPQATQSAAHIAKNAPPSAPFPADLAAGPTGVYVPILVGATLLVPRLFDRGRQGRRSEAEVSLEAIGEQAKKLHAISGTLPIGEVMLTPAIPCCLQNHGGRRKCGVEPAHWHASLWKTLGFTPAEPHYFQYSYQSDGKTFLATAVGDLDCDGVTIAYELRGEVGPAGVELRLTPPPPNQD